MGEKGFVEEEGTKIKRESRWMKEQRGKRGCLIRAEGGAEGCIREKGRECAEAEQRGSWGKMVGRKGAQRGLWGETEKRVYGRRGGANSGWTEREDKGYKEG